MKAQASRIQTLFLAYCDRPTSDHRDQLIRLHVGLVRKVIHQSRRWLAGEANCLEAIAIQGLAQAVDAYNPRRHQPFSCFAIPYIQHELQRYAQARQCLSPPTSIAVGETRLCG